MREAIDREKAPVPKEEIGHLVTDKVVIDREATVRDLVVGRPDAALAGIRVVGQANEVTRAQVVGTRVADEDLAMETTPIVAVLAAADLGGTRRDHLAPHPRPIPTSRPQWWSSF